MTTKKPKSLWLGPSNSEKRANQYLETLTKESKALSRKPKRSVLTALTSLKGWAWPAYIGDEPTNEQDKLDLANDKPFSQWVKGWHFLLSTDVVPDAKTYQPLSRSTKGKPRRPKAPNNLSETPAPPTPQPAPKTPPRAWVGTCKPCGKHTIANSTYFLAGGTCLHCNPMEKAQGNNLFLAGNATLGKQLFFFTANNAAHAEKVRQDRGYAWFVPVTTSKRNRVIDLPPVATKPHPRPSAQHWASPVEEATLMDYKPPNNTWLDDYGKEWAWYLVDTTEEDTPDTTEPPPEPPLNSAGLVDFDDFI